MKVKIKKLKAQYKMEWNKERFMNVSKLFYTFSFTKGEREENKKNYYDCRVSLLDLHMPNDWTELMNWFHSNNNFFFRVTTTLGVVCCVKFRGRICYLQSTVHSALLSLSRLSQDSTWNIVVVVNVFVAWLSKSLSKKKIIFYDFSVFFLPFLIHSVAWESPRRT